METNVKESVKVLTEAIKSDPELRIAWQSNIAMAFKDEYNNYFEGKDEDSGEVHESAHIHNIANNAANNFLGSLCETSFDRLD